MEIRSLERERVRCSVKRDLLRSLSAQTRLERESHEQGGEDREREKSGAHSSEPTVSLRNRYLPPPLSSVGIRERLERETTVRERRSSSRLAY